MMQERRQIGVAEHTILCVDQQVMDSKAVLPHLLDKQDGHIAVISSLGGN